MKIGSLEIEILASIDRLQKDMASVTGFMTGVERSVGKVNSVMTGLGVSLAGIFTVGGFASMIKATISATGHFNDLAATAGVSAAKLMSLSKVAGFSGVSAEELAGSMNKMNLQLLKSGESGGGAAQALKAIGLNYNDFMKLSPDQRMTTVANSMASYKDGSEKSAIAMALFGKSGAALVPVLKDIAIAGDLVVKATDEQIAMADDFDDNLKRLDASGGKWKQTLAMGMLPALNDATEAILGAANETGGFNDQLKQLSNNGTLDQWTRGAITGITYLMDAFSGVGNVFKSVGLIIGAGMAQIVTYIVGGVDAAKKAIHGDFAGAMDEWGRSVAKADSITAEFNADMQKLWTDKTVGQGIRERMEATEALRKTQKELGDTTQDSKAKIDTSGLSTRNEAAIEAQEKATQNLIKSGKDFVDSIKTKLGVAQQDLDQNGKMTEGQKLMLDMQQKLTQGKLVLTAAQQNDIKVTADIIDQKNKEIKARNDLGAAIKKESDGIYGEIQNTYKATEALKFKNDTMFMSKSQMDDLHAAELLKKADDYEALANDKERAGGMGDLAEKYREAAAALRDQATEEKRGAVLETAKAANEEWKKTVDSIENGLTDSLMRAFESGKGFGQAFKDTMVNAFKTMVLQPVVKAGISTAGSAIGSIFGMSSAGASASGAGGTGGAGGAGIGALGSMGVWGLAAAGAVAAVGVWNKSQADKLIQYSAAYRQKNQTTGSVLGMGDAQSESISKGLQSLGDNSKSLLDVNNGMYQALLAIQDGIAGTASGFAKQLGINGTGVSGIQTGSYTPNALKVAAWGVGGTAVNGMAYLTNKLFGENNVMSKAINLISGFMNGVAGKVASAIYSSKTSIVDSGIQFDGGKMSDIMNGGTMKSQNYAEVQNVKKVLGINIGQSVKTQTSDLDPVVQAQLSGVFVAAGNALKIAAKAFGKDGDEFVNSLKIDPQKLSLQGLSGDAMSKQIEAFFSTNLDKWSQSMLGGTDALKQFQQIGEGAFQTVVRLAAQITSFQDETSKLNLNFTQTGLEAIKTSQALADMAGGFDALQKSMDDYYNNFYGDDEKTANSVIKLQNAFSELGVTTLPRTRDEFRKLVEAQNLSTSAGQEMFTGLMNLQSAFAGVVPATLRLALSLGELNQLNNLGGVFSSIASSSLAARDSIANLAGGIDKLIASANQFVTDYYSQSEQSGISAKATLASLSALGIDGSSLATKDDYRKLVESLGNNLNDTTAQKQLVGLLQLGPQFAQLAEYLKTNNETLADAAKQAPQTAILEQMLPAAQTTSAAVNDVGAAVNAGNSILERIVAAIQDGNTSIADGLGQLANNSAVQTEIATKNQALQAEQTRINKEMMAKYGLSGAMPSYAYDMGGN